MKSFDDESFSLEPKMGKLKTAVSEHELVIQTPSQ